MSKDIVSELRAPDLVADHAYRHKLMNEAADEIERLRAALEYIAEEVDAESCDGKYSPWPKHSAGWMWLKARAALGKTNG